MPLLLNLTSYLPPTPLPPPTHYFNAQKEIHLLDINPLKEYDSEFISTYLKLKLKLDINVLLKSPRGGER